MGLAFLAKVALSCIGVGGSLHPLAHSPGARAGARSVMCASWKEEQALPTSQALQQQQQAGPSGGCLLGPRPAAGQGAPLTERAVPA